MKKPRKNKANSHTRKIWTVFASIILIYITVLFLSVFLSVISDLDPKQTYAVSLASLSLASFVSGIVIGFAFRKNGMLKAVVFTSPVNLFIIIASVFINSFTIDYHIILSLAALVISAAIGGIISVNSKIRR